MGMILSEREQKANKAVRGKWMALAQAVWLLLAGLALVILVATIPSYFQDFSLGLNPERTEAPEWALQLARIASTLASFTAAIVSLGLAGLLYRLKRDDRMALFLAYLFLIYGIVMAGPLERLGAIISAEPLTLSIQPLLFIMFATLLYTFPDGHFIPAWSRWLTVASILITPATIFVTLELENRAFGAWQDYGIIVVIFSLFGTGFYGQIKRYRHISSLQQRLQTKWVVYGLGLWLVLVTISSIPYYYAFNLPADEPLPLWLLLTFPLWWLGLTIVPITFTVAVLRYRLYDINLIIRRTLVYGLLTTMLLAIYVIGILALQTIFRALTGQESPLAIIVSTLAIAALFNPLRYRLQELIDRRFFRSKYDAGQTLSQFAETARDEVELELLTAELVRVLEVTMQPETVSVWLRPVSEGVSNAEPAPPQLEFRESPSV